MQEVFVLERQCDDPFYGYLLVEVYATEAAAKAEAERLTSVCYHYRYRKMPVLGS
jgi:hypothetical protein